MKRDKIRLAILASGSGSNADAICHYFSRHPSIQVALIVTNKINAGVLNVAENHSVPSIYIPNSHWQQESEIKDTFLRHNIDYIILAGFLKLIPESVIQQWNHRILNVHPSLLPKYGGKGMYGIFVHEAVKTSGDAVTGMTIHLVNNEYDKGEILFQAQCTVEPEMTAFEIGQKVLSLEHSHYSPTIENYVIETQKDNFKN
jgi:phosphoribosylglycinamide formyltransferase-1